MLSKAAGGPTDLSVTPNFNLDYSSQTHCASPAPHFLGIY